MIFLTPGPSKLHPLYPDFMKQAADRHIGSISHRSKEFEKIFQAAVESVRALLGAPADTHVFFLGSATEAMERIVQNCCARKSFHFVNGAFSERFFEIAKELGRDAAAYTSSPGEGFPFSAVSIPPDAELICLTHNETSTGVMIDSADIIRLKEQNPGKLLAVDIVSSAPYPLLSYNHVDAAFFSVQKSFGLPAGLGVLLVNDACLEKAAEISRTGQSIGSYHNFASLLSFAKKNQTPETPNVLGIFLLAKVCEELLRIGIETLRKQTDERAQRLYSFVESHAAMKPFVSIKALRSTTVVTIEVPDAKIFMDRLARLNVQVGLGYGAFKDKHLRVANFCTHTAADIQAFITAGSDR